jgi:hypothetical protein
MIDWQAIKERHRIEDVMRRLFPGLRLRRSGPGWLCKCPLHNEQEGESFSLDEKKQLWKCFGKCQCGGDVIKLVMEIHSLDATGAAEWLEGRSLTGERRVEKAVRPEREIVREEVPLVRELPHIPKIWKGEERHWDAVSKLRKLPHWCGVSLAVREGVLRFCLAYEQPAWAILDVEDACNVQVRRMDGELWFNRLKVMGVKGNWAKWPVGMSVALKHGTSEILLVEGTGDFVAAYYALADGQTTGIPVAMFGASNPIHEGALPLFSGRRVRIIEQHDEAGAGATAVWSQQLTYAGAYVEVRRVPVAGEDLNDHISAGRGCMIFE